MATVRALRLFPGGCIGQLNPEDISSYNLATDLTTAMGIYWRVKEWDFFAGNRADEIGQDATILESENYNPETEKDLICGGGGSSTFLAVPPYIDEVGEESLFGVLSIFWVGQSAGFYEGNFYPEISFFSGRDPSDINGFIASLGQFGFFYEIELPYLLPAQVTYRLEVTPKTFWPYDPGDGGGPIYDSATGEQLRAFPD